MVQLRLRVLGFMVLVVGLVFLLMQVSPVVVAAPRLQFSPTPAPVVLPSISPTFAVQFTATPTRTPTPVGPAQVEALEGPTNVRAGPDINAERLGQILPGSLYPVLGRTTGGQVWYRIQYPDSPNGTAWVFDQVVTVTGDIETIPEVSFTGAPTVDVGRAQATQTIEAMEQTPGALETATVAAMLSGVVISEGEQPPTQTPQPLPTFTFPPGPVAQSTTFIARPAQNTNSAGGLPPIIPILGLGVVGSLGLIVGILRRIS